MGSAENENAKTYATRNRLAVLTPDALAKAGMVLDESAGAADAVLLPGQPPPTDAAVAESNSEIEPLIEENQQLAQKLLMGYEGKWFGTYRGNDREIKRLREILEYGSYRFSAKYVMCMSHELVKLLDALVDSEETQADAPFDVLSILREPSEWNPKSERPPNHGRTLTQDEYMTDLKGRSVNAMSTAVDISRFAGHLINLEHMGPSDATVPLSGKDKANILKKKQSTLNGILGVARNLPPGRYTIGLPRPIDADNWREIADSDKDYSCHLFIDPRVVAEHKTKKKRGTVSDDDYASYAMSSPTGHYVSDRGFIVDADARQMLPAALGMLNTQGDRKPEAKKPLKLGILYLHPDAKDHLHITVLRPTDDWTKSKKKTKKAKPDSNDG